MPRSSGEREREWDRDLPELGQIESGNFLCLLNLLLVCLDLLLKLASKVGHALLVFLVLKLERNFQIFFLVTDE